MSWSNHIDTTCSKINQRGGVLKGVKCLLLRHRPYRDATLLDLGDTMSSAMGQSSFKFAAAKDWNEIPKELRELATISSFKIKVFKYFSELDKKHHACSVK